MNLQQLLLIVWARRKIAGWTLLATVVIVTAVSFLLPKKYVATSSLVFDTRTDPIAGAILPGISLPGYITTQTDIMESDRVANRAVKILNMGRDPEAIQQWKEATDGKIPFEYYYGQLMLRHLKIKPARSGSNVVNLEYTSSNPKFAAAAANAFAQAYVDINVELRVEPARQYASWFDERLKGLRTDLERAQAKLSAYQREKGIVATEERLDNETARLTALIAQLSAVEGEKAGIASREKNSGSELSPDVMENTIVQGIKTELAKSEAKLSELSSNVGSNHPQYRQLAAQIAGLKEQLQQEIRRISGSTVTAGKVTAQKEEELKNAIETQKQRVLQMRAEHDVIAMLAKDVETAQHAYDAVAQRINMSSLESQMPQNNNVGMLSTAIEPDTPSKPKILLNILASIFMGTLLGIGAAMGQEKLDRRVRLPEDIAGLEGIPILGVLHSKPRRSALRNYLAIARTRLPGNNRSTPKLA